MLLELLLSLVDLCLVFWRELVLVPEVEQSPVVEEVGLSTASSAASTVAMSRHYRHEDEQEDKEYKETDLGAVDEQHKSVILYLLSQVCVDDTGRQMVVRENGI